MTTIIVSGGSKGLGAAIVERLLQRGNRVATFSRKPTPFIEQLDGQPDFFYQPVDASDSAALRTFVETVHQQWGSIDGLVNNAGIAYDGVLALTNEDQIEKMLQVNLQAAIVLAKECARRMLLGGAGRIVNISSIIAQRGFSGLSVYAATKAGLIGFTRSLARELGPRNIRVNAVAPGYIETDMSESLSPEQRNQIVRRTPLGRLGTADDVVPAIEFLLSPDSDYITGQVLTVDGGSSI